MTIAYDQLKDAPRLLMEAQLKPLQGHRFQPTGFADLGPARYKAPRRPKGWKEGDNPDAWEDVEMLLVESAQSVANRMELACWDEAKDDLIDGLKGLPYIQVNCGDFGKTNTIKEFHRLNSPYIWSGEETDSRKGFQAAFFEKLGLRHGILKKKKAADPADSDSVPGVLDFRKLYRAVFMYDTNALIRGLFLEKVAGRLRMSRLLSGFIEASDVTPAESGGTKIDHVLPSPRSLGLSANDGYGNVPFPRTEFTARGIKAYFNLDLALLRGYGLNEEATNLVVALSLFKIRRFLSTGLRLRTACDLEAVDEGLIATRPEDVVLPSEEALLAECSTLINNCRQHFADPPISEVEWKPSKRKSSGKKGEDKRESEDGGISEDTDT